MLKCSQALGYRSLSTETGFTISKHIYKLFIYFFSIFYLCVIPTAQPSVGHFLFKALL
jgi:hypothetical protein